MSWKTAVSGSVTLERPGILEIEVDAIQNFPGGANKPWGFRLYMDNVLVLDTGERGAPGDFVHFKAEQQINSARTVPFSLLWAGHPDLTLQAAKCSTRVLNDTSY